MQDRTLCLVLLGAVLIGVCNGVPLITDEAAARKFVEKVSTQLYNYYDQLIHERLHIGAKEEDIVLKDYTQILKTSEALVGIVNETKAYDYSRFKDKELKYIFGKIRKSADEAVAGNANLSDMFEAQIELDVLNYHDVSDYRIKNLEVPCFPEIENRIVASNDTEELKFYWKMLRFGSIHLMTKVETIVSVMKEAANLTDMTPFDYWMRKYNFTQMENVMTQIKPLYKQLHGFIRQKLRNKYGNQAIKPNGPIPDHLFQQVLAQAWTNGSIIDDMYPHKDLPPYDSILEKNNYDTLELYKTADKFYQSLGFEPIPDGLWDTQIKMGEYEDEGDCKAIILDLTSNVYMQYCQKMDFRKFLQAHGYMGRMYYAREKKNLPAYYFPSYDLEYSIGEAVILSASTPKYLTAIDLVTDFQFTDKVLLNRLLRMGIHTLLNIPVYFVHTKVMADLFSDVVSVDEVNKHYWDLMGTYVGVEPPVDRGSDDNDFPFKFYIDFNKNTQANKFNTEVLGYKFYKKFCEISRQYPSGRLQNCDFSDNKSVGDAMKKMMKLGSSKEINEVLATLFPENPSVSAESLLEYYQPIKTWLTNKNRAENVPIGWTPTTKKIA